MRYTDHVAGLESRLVRWFPKKKRCRNLQNVSRVLKTKNKHWISCTPHLHTHLYTSRIQRCCISAVSQRYHEISCMLVLHQHHRRYAHPTCAAVQAPQSPLPPTQVQHDNHTAAARLSRPISSGIVPSTCTAPTHHASACSTPPTLWAAQVCIVALTQHMQCTSFSQHQRARDRLVAPSHLPMQPATVSQVICSCHIMTQQHVLSLGDAVFVVPPDGFADLWAAITTNQSLCNRTRGLLITHGM